MPITTGLVLGAGAAELHAQKPPYDVFSPAEAPYYCVRYEASTKPGGLTGKTRASRPHAQKA
jgi:hypothetical protein